MQFNILLLSSLVGLAGFAAAMPAPVAAEPVPFEDPVLAARDVDDFEERRALFVRAVLEELLETPEYE